jgi:hypothetical protein
VDMWACLPGSMAYQGCEAVDRNTWGCSIWVESLCEGSIQQHVCPDAQIGLYKLLPPCRPVVLGVHLCLQVLEWRIRQWVSQGRGVIVVG